MKRVIVVIALAAAPALADEILLKGGGRVTGEIVARSDDSVTVDIGGGTFTVRRSSIVRIEEGQSPFQEFQARAEKIPADDAEGWRELARWATGRALGTKAGEAWSKVVAILPDDPEANGALGRVQLDGRWVTEEESYRAQGYVKFEGDWMTPGERHEILAERQAREEADRQAFAAEVQTDQEARKARDAQEAAEREAFMRGGMSQGSDVVVWGWGSGPTLWPSTPVQQAQPGGSAIPPAGGQR